MPFIGREREVHLADAIIASRVGSACLLTGETGIGKSALAREIARKHDTTVLSVSPSERMWPLSGLSAVAAALGGRRGAALDSVLARGRDWPEHMLAEELSRTLHLVTDEPGVLVIDDLDEMDSSSLTVLSFVFGRLRGTGVSVVATVRTMEGRHDFAGMTHTRIERLSFDESVELARATIGPGTASAVLHIVAAFTGGDPCVLSHVRLTSGEATGEDALPLPLRVVDDPTRRRPRVARPTRDPRSSALLDLLSVGPIYAYDRLSTAAAEIGFDIDELIDAGVVSAHGEYARMTDPALRLRHHAALSPEERRRLHARAADDHEGDALSVRKWHESFLSPSGDRRHLLGAAVRFARDGEIPVAIEFAERALSGELEETPRQRALVELGDALVLQSHDLLGQHYLRRAGGRLDPDVRVRAATAAMRAGTTVDHVVDDALVACSSAGDDPAAIERLLCESARLHLSLGEVAPAVERIVAAVDRGVAGAETRWLVELLDLAGIPVPVRHTGRDVAAPSVDVDTPIEHATLSIAARLLREEYPAVRRELRALLVRNPRPAPMWRDRLLRLLVTAEVRAGDPVGAREAVTAWRQEWLPGREPDATTTLLLAQAASIDPADPFAADLVRRGRDQCRREGTPALLAHFAAIEGALALTDGRYDDAVTALRAARDAAPRDDPAVLRTDADLIEALWLSGRRGDARREMERLEHAGARRERRWTTLAIARSRAVCSSDRDGDAAFRDAEAVYRTDDAPYERLRLRSSWERCVPRVEGTTVRPAPLRSDIGTALSRDEQEIIALVERGLRNREIAAALFISLRSVELRLTRIYRALGVSSRAQLVAYLHGAATA